MGGVVIIHALDDGAPAQALAEKLRADGYEAATDLTGGPLRDSIEDADVTVALWSPRSVAYPELVGEAAFARGLGRLIHARMHNTPAPREFASDPQIDLTGWRGEETFAGWLNLRAAVEGVMNAAYPRAQQPPPPPPPRPRADFGDPYAPPPPYQDRPYSAQDQRPYPAAQDQRPYPTAQDQRPYPSQDRPYSSPYEPYGSPYQARPYGSTPNSPSGGSSGLRLAIIGMAAFAVVAGVGFGAYSLIQGNRSGAAAESSWNSLDKTDPIALRAFIDDEPGRFRAPAEAALEGLEVDELSGAREADTVEAYQRFLDGFPDTRRSAEINGRIAMLRQREADAAMLTDTPAPPVEPLAPLTEPAPAAPEPPDSAPIDLGPGGPVPLTPRGPNPGDEVSSTEEQLRRALTGEDQSRTDDELRRRIRSER